MEGRLAECTRQAMAGQARKGRIGALAVGFLLLLLVAGVVAAVPAPSAQGASAGARPPAQEALRSASPAEPDAPCPGGPTIDGIVLDECYVESFSVGGGTKSITVWYTKNQVVATRVLTNGIAYLEHWIDSDAQAQQAAAWGRQAWEQYYEIFNRHPYHGSCDNINLQIEDGIRGYAEVPQPGYCWIHIGAEGARNGGDPAAIFHEFGHAIQDGYSNCLVALMAGYPGNAEYTEGYACVCADAVSPEVDNWYYENAVAVYSPTVSFFDHGGDNVGNKYYLEQVGVEWSSHPQRYHMDAVRAHLAECELQGDLYVLDTLIPSLTGGALTEKKLFLNFFAANWAKDWADPSTQPELVYSDDDTVSYGSIWLAHDAYMSGGTKFWPGEKTPDDWAATYYQVLPMPGCDYVSVAVDGWPGAYLGINLMAADTVAPTSVVRSASTGNSLARTFAGFPTHNRVVAVVNAFDLVGSYDVTFQCVTPAVELLEPRPAPNSSLVGGPDSPVAVLARWRVTSEEAPLPGLPESAFQADAGGDAMSFVPGSFQQVGAEYWAILLPPVKPAGTTLVDMKLCLDGSLCDTNTDALLYVDRGSTDAALLFDGSFSMAIEDIAGEGSRLDNAKKAGNVLAGLLQEGDRVLVMDFSTSGNDLDIRTLLARTDVVVPGTIQDARDAIDQISARQATPIGAALREAKNRLQAVPYSLNPKVIVLLSDGEENVPPYYDEVRQEILDSGTIVDTVGFGPPGQVGEAKLAQIAADTGGTFRFVPTTQGTMATVSAEQVDALRRHGVSEEMVSRLTAAWQPGPLALDNVYDYFDAQAQGATRLFSVAQIGVPYNEWRVVSQYVGGSTASLRFVVAGKQVDDGSSTYRDVAILPPGADPERGWIPISPPGTELPPTWDVRNSPYDDEVVIPGPEKGEWKVRARYRQASAATFDFAMMASAQSEYLLQGRFLSPVVDNQGHAGDVVPIVATLLNRNGAVPGATIAGTAERPGGVVLLLLSDDGQHNDGAAGDGIYGTLYAPTDTGGAYNVRLVASWDDPLNPGNTLHAEWLGAFYIEPPDVQDADGDGMPDAWEQRCGLDPSSDDSREDLDQDGLLNLDEFHQGTVPCEDDTDHGGEGDSSEVGAGRNPLEPADDTVPPLSHIGVRGLNGRIRIDWAHPRSYDSMRAFVSTEPGELGSPVEMGSSGLFTLTEAVNDQTYYLTFQALGQSAVGAFSDPEPVIPKADPDAPSGYLVINGGQQATASRQVTLTLLATDAPPQPLVEANRSAVDGPPAVRANAASGALEMRISNSPFLTGAAWEPLAFEKPWTLGESGSGVHVVYAQFRDAAGNESLVVWDDIRLVSLVYLPLVMRQAP
jgi:hypothetical protein